MKLSVIMACHNRREMTVKSILRAQAAANAASVRIDFTIFDDGSSDGTAAALAILHSEITVIAGDGSAFWARGMSTAESIKINDPSLAAGDYLVWLNDDVDIDLDAFVRLRAVAEANPNAIVAGAMREPTGKAVTYSGLNRQGVHPLRFASVAPTELLQPVDTFNGNLVLVPILIARELGGIDGSFSHALADIDYGLRAGRNGIHALLAPGTLGVCAGNPPAQRRTAGQDWEAFTGPKGGGNFSSLRRILRKSHRRTWLVYIATTYLLWWGRRGLTDTKRFVRPS